ncbi:hypothetical protein VP01_404g2 [Puccinia sorghi]|uniref:Uncharacterized protein n=1 Tax=Puccinia sorghi TaxID=27349 RepID=A0A0L6URN2_9BASI|nr:hypothetical protein VP01_404g2 [Puccinia sorghi]
MRTDWPTPKNPASRGGPRPFPLSAPPPHPAASFPFPPNSRSTAGKWLSQTLRLELNHFQSLPRLDNPRLTGRTQDCGRVLAGRLSHHLLHLSQSHVKGDVVTVRLETCTLRNNRDELLRHHWRDCQLLDTERNLRFSAKRPLGQLRRLLFPRSRNTGSRRLLPLGLLGKRNQTETSKELEIRNKEIKEIRKENYHRSSMILKRRQLIVRLMPGLIEDLVFRLMPGLIEDLVLLLEMRKSGRVRSKIMKSERVPRRVRNFNRKCEQFQVPTKGGMNMYIYDTVCRERRREGFKVREADNNMNSVFFLDTLEYLFTPLPLPLRPLSQKNRPKKHKINYKKKKQSYKTQQNRRSLSLSFVQQISMLERETKALSAYIYI